MIDIAFRQEKNLLILPEGRFSHKFGLQVVDNAAISRVLKAVKKLGRDIPVDYGHESFSTPNAPAAGWLDFKSLHSKPDGLYGKIVWTKDALEQISQKKFRFLSPVLAYNPAHSKGGELHIDRIVGIGLTNHPNIQEMQPLFNQFQTEEKMNELLEKLKKALGLPPETEESMTLESAMAKLEELNAVQDSFLQVKTALGFEPETTVEEIVKSIVPPQEPAATENEAPPTRKEWQELKDEVTALKQKEVSNQVENAITNGKILPAQRKWAMNYASTDMEGFNRFLANSRPVVKMGALIPQNIASEMAPAPLDPAQENINRLLGISREVFDKYNQPS